MYPYNGRNVKRSMLDMLPRYYDDSIEVDAILSANASKVERAGYDAQDLLNQFFIDTATWGLRFWEEVCDIKTDESKPIDQRRALIKSRLRGFGTVTVELIKEVAEAHTYGEVSVIEKPSTYSIVIKFIGKRGRPANLDDLLMVLRETIPAHLGIDFEFTYLIWDELDAQFMTWDNFDARLFTWDGLLVWNPSWEGEGV